MNFHEFYAGIVFFAFIIWMSSFRLEAVKDD